jgi:hypothetical protein
VPTPLRGLVVIAEFGSVVEADLAVGRLSDAGIEATSSYDPTLNTVVGYMASDRTVAVLVRERDRSSALEVLSSVGDLPPEFTDDEYSTWTRTRSGALRRRYSHYGIDAVVGILLAALVFTLIFALVEHL